MANWRRYRSLIFGRSSHAAAAALAIAIAIAIVFALTVVLTQLAQAQTFTVLHQFTGGRDGANPAAGLTMDKAGNLYGTAAYGGGGDCNGGCGTVFRLTRKGSGWVFTPSL